MRNFSKLLIIGLGLLCFSAKNPPKPFAAVLENFLKGYNDLGLPDFTFDYRDYFSSIPSEEQLARQQKFFEGFKQEATAFKREHLSTADKIRYDHLLYELDFNLQRLNLESEWVKDGRKIPLSGLHQLKNYKDWYSFFTKKYTSTDISPEQIFEMGKREVARVQQEILQLRTQLGFKDSLSFYTHLKTDAFYITDKQVLIRGFEKIDSTVRKHLPNFVGKLEVPPIFAMEWPEAGANTPPGIYLSSENNAYGKDVFQFNFYGSRYNKRAMEWLYMHEGIPGHHLQFSFKKSKPANPQVEGFIYPGNFEGWACYIEYFGKEVGLYKDPYSYSGKHEWDLVRSARLVLDAGIHYYGWTREEALRYWKANVPGQDEIAEREITRVTNWTAQALSYKVGADFIFKLKEKWEKKHPAERIENFHRAFLEFGPIPLPVIEKNLV
jgi:uncharacterized protein (DUF885 family)